MQIKQTDIFTDEQLVESAISHYASMLIGFEKMLEPDSKFSKDFRNYATEQIAVIAPKLEQQQKFLRQITEDGKTLAELVEEHYGD